MGKSTHSFESGCLSDTGLFGKNTLQLPLPQAGSEQASSQTKSPPISQWGKPTRWFLGAGSGKPKLRSTKRRVGCSTKKSLAGSKQEGAGLGWGEALRFWSEANWKEAKELVVSEVTRVEKERYEAKAVSQCQHGSWTTWDGAVDRRIILSDLRNIPQEDLLGLTYATLPCPWNLRLESRGCSLLTGTDTEVCVSNRDSLWTDMVQ